MSRLCMVIALAALCALSPAAARAGTLLRAVQGQLLQAGVLGDEEVAQAMRVLAPHLNAFASETQGGDPAQALRESLDEFTSAGDRRVLALLQDRKGAGSPAILYAEKTATKETLLLDGQAIHVQGNGSFEAPKATGFGAGKPEVVVYAVTLSATEERRLFANGQRLEATLPVDGLTVAAIPHQPAWIVSWKTADGDRRGSTVPQLSAFTTLPPPSKNLPAEDLDANGKPLCNCAACKAERAAKKKQDNETGDDQDPDPSPDPDPTPSPDPDPDPTPSPSPQVKWPGNPYGASPVLSRSEVRSVVAKLAQDYMERKRKTLKPGMSYDEWGATVGADRRVILRHRGGVDGHKDPTSLWLELHPEFWNALHSAAKKKMAAAQGQGGGDLD